MKVPYSWLREFLEGDVAISQLRDVLDDLGLVVEDVQRVGAGLESVVVAQVDEVHAIPGADRIRRVKVSDGTTELEIVCGATNFAAGDLVPLAPVGATLPDGMVITQRTMRGVTSHGMLCSARELGLGDDQGGLMILNEYDGAAPGVKLTDLLGTAADEILDISPEGNRPDAWSIEGIARDYCARVDGEIQEPPIATPNGTAPTSGAASTANDAPELCGRITVAALAHVTVTDSPRWLRQRLELSGMRAINNVVDASNYVMLELGQPTHPYDAAKVAGHHIGVRAARAGETVTTLDGVVRTLGEPGRGLGDTGVDCVIVDGDDHVIGIAGVMGGSASEISAETTEVILEAAHFDSMSIARTSKKLGLRTEASRRFERGVDPGLAERAVARFVEILKVTCPNVVWLADPIVVHGHAPERSVVTVTDEQISALLGTPIDATDAAHLLSALDFDVRMSGHTLTVTAPGRRPDIRTGIAGRADVIEEVARLYSYARLSRRTPMWTRPGSLGTHQRFVRRIREIAVGLGLTEAWTPSFVTAEQFARFDASPLRVIITNPQVNEENVLRGSMAADLIDAWGRNLERGRGDVAFFEIGTVVTHPGALGEPRASRGGVGGTEKIDLPTERELLTVLLAREGDDATTAVAIWSIISARLGLADVAIRTAEAPRGWHPSRHAVLVDRVTGCEFGRVGEADPYTVAELVPSAGEDRRVALIEIDLTALADELKVTRRARELALPSRFPPATMDLAFVTPDAVNSGDLAAALRAADPLVESVTFFDAFRGGALADGERSLAYAVRLSAPDRTLGDDEITSARARLIGAGELLGARLR